ncbi:MAG: hypothetical protein K2M46_03935 [Lachnospiraceae bacterium]|nr:hypothetical protein [Lachnospiraceae bacterium]
MATGDTRMERGNGERKNTDRSYQRKNSKSSEKGGFRKTEGKPYNRPKDGMRPKEGAKPYRPRFDKDEEESSYKYSRGNDRRNQKSQQMSKENAKIKEQQPDKMDIVKRLEKEKKAMEKKSNNQNSSKNKGNTKRVQRPIKRSNNIDWTREYENDSYDDDDMSYLY